MPPPPPHPGAIRQNATSRIDNATLLARMDVLNRRKNISGARANKDIRLIPAKKTCGPVVAATKVCVFTVTVNGTEPPAEICSVEGLIEQAAACGAPVQASVTAPVKPPLGDKFRL